jgi:SPP1 gp7 family putative phage head morphogenesis protein
MAALQKKLIQIPEINGFTHELLKNTLTEGLGKVETVSQLQDRVRETFNFTESRSLTIARTETGQAAGVARDAAMGELGVEETEWSTAGDDVVRDSHADLDGDTVKRGEPFKNGLLYPCDPAGDPGEVINCRCVSIPIVAKE